MNFVLVREAALRGEPELLADFGIYGDRAVSTQEVDAEQSDELFFR